MVIASNFIKTPCQGAMAVSRAVITTSSKVMKNEGIVSSQARM
ncbi:hypothetical protein BDEG_21759 [Batrachochytrium dendrobatidis JEL423]|uniref:Uncharacterized protein n=1 Tax=Batrachochytrium dendrobatidis (strain JEL423) TaxID=403673 RepID=A0A177WCE2_BATDL|nr:hypothetical protein BDEG_21759 [Batrachochytrium dendrobatidis JEL423]